VAVVAFGYRLRWRWDVNQLDFSGPLVVFRSLLLSGGLGLSQVGNHHDRDSEMEQQAAEA
jgi:hypothetical protein